MLVEAKIKYKYIVGQCVILCFFIFDLDCNELYLELMKKVLINSIYQDDSVYLNQKLPYNFVARENGGDWPAIAHTMIGLHALNNIQFCMENILKIIYQAILLKLAFGVGVQQFLCVQS